MFTITQNKMLRIGIAFGVCALIVMALYFFPGRHIFKYRERLKAGFRASQEHLGASYALVRNFSNPQKAIEDIEARARELKEMGSASRQLPKIIQSLAHPASELNINVISLRQREDIKTGEDSLPSGISSAHIELVMACPYKVLAEYLKAISRLPTACIVERLSIEKAKEEKTKEPASFSEGNKAPDKPKDAAPELLITLMISTYLVWEI